MVKLLITLLLTGILIFPFSVQAKTAIEIEIEILKIQIKILTLQIQRLQFLLIGMQAFGQEEITLRNESQKQEPIMEEVPVEKKVKEVEEIVPIEDPQTKGCRTVGENQKLVTKGLAISCPSRNGICLCR